MLVASPDTSILVNIEATFPESTLLTVSLSTSVDVPSLSTISMFPSTLPDLFTQRIRLNEYREKIANLECMVSVQFQQGIRLNEYRGK